MLVLVLVLVGRSAAPERDTDSANEPPTSGSTAGEPTEDSAPSEAAPPLEVSDTTSLTVPVRHYLTEQHVTRREAAAALGMSAQRVQQLSAS